MAVAIHNRSQISIALDDMRCLMSPLSSFEKFLILVEDRNVVRLALSYWDPLTVIRVGQCNTRTRFAIKFYESEVWDPCDVLRRYLWKVTELLALMESSKAIAFGPSVLRFFDRTICHTSPLDICVGYAGAERLAAYLEGEGYYFRPRSGEPPRFTAAVVDTLAQLSYVKLTVNGERNSNQHDNDSRVFAFQRAVSGIEDSERVNLHLTRCDPLRHVLSLHSCALSDPFYV